MIEVALGYKTLRNWREWHESVEALQRSGAVLSVEAVTTPAKWLANVVQTVSEGKASTVLLVKVGDGDWRPVVMTPLSEFARLQGGQPAAESMAADG
jgi:hypothetical protein